MCDCAGGSYGGVAKDAQIISVKGTEYLGDGLVQLYLHILIGEIAQIVRDVTSKGRQGFSILTCAWGNFFSNCWLHLI